MTMKPLGLAASFSSFALSRALTLGPPVVARAHAAPPRAEFAFCSSSRHASRSPRGTRTATHNIATRTLVRCPPEPQGPHGRARNLGCAFNFHTFDHLLPFNDHVEPFALNTTLAWKFRHTERVFAVRLRYDRCAESTCRT